MTTTELRWDPFDRALHEDPYAVWKRLRDEAPVYHNEEYNFYALSRFAAFEDATEFFRRGDCGFSCSLRAGKLESRGKRHSMTKSENERYTGLGYATMCGI